MATGSPGDRQPPSAGALIAPHRPVLALYAHRNLLRELVVRDVFGRYRGSYGGLGWSFLQPALMIGIYYFVFGIVFQAKWTIRIGDDATFVLMLFAGLIVHSFFAECLNRSTGSIIQHPNFVKRVIFPLETLPAAIVGSALVHAGISALVLAAFSLAIAGGLPVTALLFPVVMAPLFVLTLGLSWIIAAVGVYFRDLAQLTTFVTSGLLFVSPVFYPVDAVPPAYRALVHLSPLTLAIEDMRRVMIAGELPDAGSFLLACAIAIAVFTLGYACFQHLRRGFADVM